MTIFIKLMYYVYLCKFSWEYISFFMSKVQYTFDDVAQF